ncbi:type I DNA topoisomerase [Bacteriovoracales bacterium]|nr:type I DNA topoisomerase [Bacteriovoracales bacterium]
MSLTHLVIVESPTKAKTIKKFLSKDYIVEASMGHLRDLPQSAAEIPKDLKKEDWAKLGVDVDNNFEPLYVTPKGKFKFVRELKKKLKSADVLYLATDEDREGESISWHLTQILSPKVPVKRMVFHEITKQAIAEALENCRDIDMQLVRAQEARRVLDRIFGYTLSPLLWKKICYGLSAGRVQSSGLRLIVERERERMIFKKADYWGIKVEGLSLEEGKAKFTAKITHSEGLKVAVGKDFDDKTGKLVSDKGLRVLTEKESLKLVEEGKKEDWKVEAIKETHSVSRPLPPFITSTLQQEGNRKLGMSTREVMGVAQKLYEEGLITYMRTDSPTLSKQAVKAARDQIQSLYGEEFLSPEIRQFKSKSKGAQEAHEAIRPAGDTFVLPKDCGFSGKEASLYELIWKRTLACQMAEAKKSSQVVKIKVGESDYQANGTKILFPGFLRVYVEGKDDPNAALDDKEVILPHLEKGDILSKGTLKPSEHSTKPPARFTEASLVNNLEKKEIGRPSTYASIINTILDRGYVRRVGNTMVPTFTGLAVIQLLENYFENLINYEFTRTMEQSLDDIAYGELDHKKYLKKFYLGKTGLKSKVEENEKKIKPEDTRTISLPHINGKKAEIKVGRFGPYIISDKKTEADDEIRASIPEDIAPADLKVEDIDQLIEMQEKGPVPIGVHPDNGENIYCLIGRYGAYLQLGEKTEENPKPRRSSLPKNLTPQTVELSDALRILSLPRELGAHPEKGEPVLANVGRFGPYVMCDGEFRSLKKEDDVYEVVLERALELLAQEKKASRRSKLLKDFGDKSKLKKKIGIYEGKYGPYIKFGSKNIGLPDDIKSDEEKVLKLTLKEVEKIIEEKKKK